MSRIAVLHCDDSAPYRRLVEVMLETFEDLELVGSVAEHATAVQEAERRYQRRIELTPRKEYHLEQFDLIGR